MYLCGSRGGASLGDWCPANEIGDNRYPTTAGRMVTRRTRPWIFCAAAVAQLIMPCRSSLRGGSGPEMLGSSRLSVATRSDGTEIPGRALIAGNLQQHPGNRGMRRLQGGQACSSPSPQALETVRECCIRVARLTGLVFPFVFIAVCRVCCLMLPCLFIRECCS